MTELNHNHNIPQNDFLFRCSSVKCQRILEKKNFSIKTFKLYSIFSLEDDEAENEDEDDNDDTHDDEDDDNNNNNDEEEMMLIEKNVGDKIIHSSNLICMDFTLFCFHRGEN